MKVKFSSAVTMFVVAALLVSALGIFKPAFAQTPEIYLVPSANNYTTSTATIGTTFDVTAWVKDAPLIGAWQLYIEFNDAILNVTKWVEPTADPQYIFAGKTTSANPTPPNPGYVHLGPNLGRIQVAANLFPTPPTQPPSSGNGKLAVVTFIITALPAKLGSLNCALNINKASTTLLDPDGNDVTPLTKTSGSYSITWVAPAAPHMGFSQPDWTFGQDPPTWNGTTFNVGLVIKGLEAPWALSGASFTFLYTLTDAMDVLAGAADVTIAPLWTGPNNVAFVPGAITITVSNPSSTPSGDVLVATVKFTIINQKVAPPYALGYYDESDFSFADFPFFEDHVGPIPVAASEFAYARVYAMRLLSEPWFEVSPTTITLGPNPVIGETFDIDVKLVNLESLWYTVGYQFRLFFDDTVIEPISIVEGPFLQDPQWNLYGTFFFGSYETLPAPHILAAGILFPNGVGEYDQTEFPNPGGVICTITFKVIKQECPNPFTSPLTLGSVFGEWLLDKNGDYIGINEANNVNGLVTILPFDTPGRVIDVYGGAKNDGYWTGYPAPFPAPLGGQGPDHWMDLVFPQAEVTMYATLTYNYWPVQSKQVGFEIEGPYEKDQQGNLVPKQRYSILAKLSATTDANGVAVITFRMPWPCDDPDGITGIWKITGTATVADVVIDDVVIFYYERACYLTSVTTDKYYYNHEEYVKVTVTCRTHSVQYYPKLVSVVIMDDLGVPFGMALISSQLGGATFCTWKYQSHTVEIFIPKYAYAGYAHVHVNCFDKDPTDGGFAYCPEFAPAPEIQIGPY